MRKNFEVINVGVCSYNLLQIYEVFKEVLEHEPDVIIYGLFDNDLDFVNTVKKEGGKRVIISYNDDTPYITDVPFSKFLLKHSKFWRSVNRLLVNTPPFKNIFNIRYYNPNTEIAVDTLKSMVAICDEKKVLFYVFLIPDLADCQYPSFYDGLAYLNEDYIYSNFSLDLRSALDGDCAKIRIDYMGEPIDGHPTPDGHKLFAKLLYNFLMQKEEFKNEKST